MKKLIASITLTAAAFALAACGPAATSENGGRSANASASPAAGSAGGANRAELPPAASAHGGSGAAAPPGAPAPPAGGQPEMDTAALDAKVKIAEAKAKVAGASEADKKAAAAAYVERGNVFRDAGQPQLYKFALGDYRRALRYDPGNAEARAKMDEIVAIYQGMGRPVPTTGLDDK